MYRCSSFVHLSLFSYLLHGRLVLCYHLLYCRSSFLPFVLFSYLFCDGLFLFLSCCIAVLPSFFSFSSHALHRRLIDLPMMKFLPPSVKRILCLLSTLPAPHRPHSASVPAVITVIVPAISVFIIRPRCSHLRHPEKESYFSYSASSA